MICPAGYMTATGAEPMPMHDLYEADVLEWSERQAGLLRRRAAGELVNDAELDWPNIAEEIESVGRDQLHAVQSLLLQSLLHLLKAGAWPLSRDAPTWRAEALVFRGQAADRYTPSMRRRIDLDRIYRKALRGVPESIDGQAPLPVPPS